MCKWINLWWNYPFSTAIRYLEQTDQKVTGVALRIGPLAFCVCWRDKRTFVENKTTQEKENGDNKVFV